MPRFLLFLVLTLGWLVVLSLAGCAERARTVGDRVLERVEKPTADGGKIITERERTQVDEEKATKADLAAAMAGIQALINGLQGNLPGALAALVPPPPKVPTAAELAQAVPQDMKIMGMPAETVIGTMLALWAGERGVAAYHKRRRRRLEPAPKD